MPGTAGPGRHCGRPARLNETLGHASLYFAYRIFKIVLSIANSVILNCWEIEAVLVYCEYVVKLF